MKRSRRNRKKRKRWRRRNREEQKADTGDKGEGRKVEGCRRQRKKRKRKRRRNSPVPKKTRVHGRGKRYTAKERGKYRGRGGEMSPRCEAEGGKGR